MSFETSRTQRDIFVLNMIFLCFLNYFSEQELRFMPKDRISNTAGFSIPVGFILKGSL